MLTPLGDPATKWSHPEVRRGLGPGGRIAEIETAGGVERVLGCASELTLLTKLDNHEPQHNPIQPRAA